MDHDNFCVAGKGAITLILANKARFAFATAFTHFSLIVGKVALMCATSMGLYIVITSLPQFNAQCDPQLDAYKNVTCTPVTTPLVPVIINLIVSYFVAAAFMYVVSVSIDTILLCFSWDINQNDKDGHTPQMLHLHHDSCLRRTVDGQHPHQIEKRKAEHDKEHEGKIPPSQKSGRG
jgi:hypothetical protein